MLLSGARNDHEVSRWHVLLHYLSDRTDCVNDGGASWVGHEHPDLVEPADRDISKSAFGIVNDVDVVGNRSGGVQDRERRMGIKHLRLANILQREPDLLAVWRRRDIRAERAQHGDPPNNLLIGDGDHNCLRSKGRADIAIFPDKMHRINEMSFEHPELTKIQTNRPIRLDTIYAFDVLNVYQQAFKMHQRRIS